MVTNLTPGYVAFIDGGGCIEHLVQELIDRAQYTPGFIELLHDTVELYEGPFERIDTPDGPIRRVKSSFLKNEPNETSNNAEPHSGDNGDRTL